MEEPCQIRTVLPRYLPPLTNAQYVVLRSSHIPLSENDDNGLKLHQETIQSILNSVHGINCLAFGFSF